MSENPKDAEARALGKPRLDLLEPTANEQIAAALANGADRYGIRNFVKSPIAARVYVAAMRRHLDAWLDGEDDAPDSGLHHLAHIGANVHVVLAALKAGTFIDDRAGDAPERPCPLEGSCRIADSWGGYETCQADCAQRAAEIEAGTWTGLIGERIARESGA